MSKWVRMKCAVLAGVFAAGTAYAGVFTLTNETFLQGVWFAANSTLTTADDSGTPMPLVGKLSREYAPGEIVWAKERSITFDGQMHVLEGTVASGSYATISLTANSLASFNRAGSPLQLVFSKPIPLKAYGVDASASTALTLYPDGSIRSASLNGPITFFAKNSRIYMLAATTTIGPLSTPTQFWPTDSAATAGPFKIGQVRRGFLQGDHVHLVDVFPSNSAVGFDEAGELNYLQCQSTCSYKRIVMAGGGTVEILPSGIFTLLGNQAVIVGSRTYPPAQKLLVTPEGTVIAASAPQ